MTFEGIEVPTVTRTGGVGVAVGVGVVQSQQQHSKLYPLEQSKVYFLYSPPFTQLGSGQTEPQAGPLGFGNIPIVSQVRAPQIFVACAATGVEKVVVYK